MTGTGRWVVRIMGRAEGVGADPVVRSLLRQLVARLLEKGPAEPPCPGEVQELLDAEIDGVRCRCVRVAAVRTAKVALSPREREIARMVAKGRTNQAIADVLGISAWTVSTHLRRIFAKLGVNSRAAMVAGVLDGERWPGGDTDDPVSQLRVTPERANQVRASPQDVTTRAAGDPVAFRVT